MFDKQFFNISIFNFLVFFFRNTDNPLTQRNFYSRSATTISSVIDLIPQTDSNRLAFRCYLKKNIKKAILLSENEIFIVIYLLNDFRLNNCIF